MVPVATIQIISHVKQLQTMSKQMGMAVYQHNLNYKNRWWAKFDSFALICWPLM